MGKKRQSYSADFKAKVVLLAIEGNLTTAQICSKHGLQGTQITRWKKEAIKLLPSLFGKDSSQKEKVDEQKVEIETLYKQVGKLSVQNEFLREKLFP